MKQQELQVKGKFKLIAWWLVFVILLTVFVILLIDFNITNEESILASFGWGIVGMIYLFPERKRVKE